MRTLILSAALLALLSPVLAANAPQAAAKPAAVKKGAKPAAPAQPSEPETLDEDRMAVVPRVMTGPSHCEFGRTVHVDPHPTLAGRFVLKSDKLQATMTPQPTTTGVIRLENSQQGLVWLQVPIKSMLMNAKAGQRVADACVHKDQAAEVEALKAAASASTAN